MRMSVRMSVKVSKDVCKDVSMGMSVKDVYMGMSVRISAYRNVSVFDGTFVASALGIGSSVPQ